MKLLGLIILTFVFTNVQGKKELTNRIFVNVDAHDLTEVKRELEHHSLRYIEKVVPRLYIFKYEGSDPHDLNLEKIKTTLKSKIINIEHIVKSIDELSPDELSKRSMAPSITDNLKNIFFLSPRHGMGVEEAWKAGFTGLGVTIAVIDVGVDVDLPDLAPNINHALSINLVSGGTNVFPERYFSHRMESIALTDHGNRCIGLIASRRFNTSCSVGIAHNSSIAVIKLFSVPNYAWIREKTRLEYFQDSIAKALSYRIQDIDIFSNSWAVNTFQSFTELPFDVKLALLDGIKNGRHQKGSIYVFPVWSLSGGYANSIFTVSVNSMNPFGGIPRDYSKVSACTLTSAFGESTSINATYMVTSSHDVLNCTKDFKGTSASTAMVSAMIGLALEANPKLTWRDVQHIIVAASNHQGLGETSNFKQNGAGHYFHKVFGFGLLNAFDLVMIAKTWTNVDSQKVQKENSIFVTPSDTQRVRKKILTSTAYVYIHCREEQERCCVDKVEHVVVTLSYKTPNEKNLQLYITSPNDTQSILMDRGQSHAKNKTQRRYVQFTSVNFWDEEATGMWSVTAKQFKYNQDQVDFLFGITAMSLTVTGTQYSFNQQRQQSVNGNTNMLYCIEVLFPDETNINSNSDEVNKSSLNNASLCFLLLYFILKIVDQRF